MKSEVIGVATGRREGVHDITAACAKFTATVAEGGDGLLHVFVPHATAGLALMELGAGSDADLLAALAEILPAGDRWRHAHGARGHGRADGPAGVRPAVPRDTGADGPDGAGYVAIGSPHRPERGQYGQAGPPVVPWITRVGEGGPGAGMDFASGPFSPCAGSRSSVDCAGKQCRRGDCYGPRAILARAGQAAGR